MGARMSYSASFHLHLTCNLVLWLNLPLVEVCGMCFSTLLDRSVDSNLRDTRSRTLPHCSSSALRFMNALLRCEQYGEYDFASARPIWTRWLPFFRRFEQDGNVILTHLSYWLLDSRLTHVVWVVLESGCRKRPQHRSARASSLPVQCKSWHKSLNWI